MRTLLVDNHDSYTYNLFQLLARVNGVAPTVLRNDDPDLAVVDLDAFDGVVISPGPGNPNQPADLGHLRALLERCSLPVLGVCLGHQALAVFEGARVTLAPQPRHGWVDWVRHDGDGLFAGIPSPLRAMRYHSWRVAEPVPQGLMTTAYATDGVVMALAHRRLPRWGVQFHPESVATAYGAELLDNFRELAGVPVAHRRAGPGAGIGPTQQPSGQSSRPTLGVIWRSLPGPVDVEALHAFVDARAGRLGSMWLDSAAGSTVTVAAASAVAPPAVAPIGAPTASATGDGVGRFSYVAGPLGPLGESITWRVGQSTVTCRPERGPSRELAGDPLATIANRLEQRRAEQPALPFDFLGGYIGFLGYEAKAVLGFPAPHRSGTPDASFVFVDRLFVVDHVQDRLYLVALHELGAADRAAAQTWVDDICADWAATNTCADPREEGIAVDADHDGGVQRLLVRPREQYLADIDECLRELRRGESYEICLTNQAQATYSGSDGALYRRLRRLNPAPFAALLRLPGVTVLSSSPERFLRVGADGRVEAKPIKGTSRRDRDPVRDRLLAQDLRSQTKSRSENLMIVDLLRNDLGRVCEVGTVEVPSLLAVESYATVHQLVSTVRGRLRDDRTAVDAVRACFPGGSMTGAPKLRTMAIIDRLERRARGVYSGALGYFSVNGAAQLSVVIRTAVRVGDRLSIGAGGAIVLESDPIAEFEEMRLKAATVLAAATTPYAPAEFATSLAQATARR